MGTIYQSIPGVTVNGSQGTFAGGYIYNYDYSVGYSEQPNKLSLSMVLADNSSSFNVPDINLNSNLYTISFGGFNFQGYVYSVRQELNSSEKILHCTFVDRSIILDQIYVGLKYRFTLAEPHILIGEEVLVETTTPGTPTKDGTTRCINCSNLEEVVIPAKTGDPNCAPIDSPEDVDSKYDIQYQFSELLAEARKKISIGLFGKSGWGSYTGTLREVLSSWGSDLCFSFYFNGTSNTIEFIDLATGLSIPSSVGSTGGNLKSYSIEKTAEGSYTQGEGTFTSKSEDGTPTDTSSQNKLSTRIYNFTKEVYTPLILNYAGPAFGTDAALGLLAAADSESRDNFCKATGQYNRIGFLSPFSYFVDFFLPKLKSFGEVIGDSNLASLAGQGWVRAMFAEVNESVKEFYLAAEKTALDAYGKEYRVSGPVPPVNRRDVECLPGGKFRKITTYESYPDFNDQGRWMKDTGTTTIGTLGQLFSKGNVVYSLEGDTRTAFAEYFTEVRSALLGTSKNYAVVFIGGSTFYVPYCCASNTSEEPDHPAFQKPWQHNCPLECENTSDPCDEYLKCGSDPYSVQQGITSSIGQAAGNVVAPSIASFKGWHKKNEEYTKVFPGNVSAVPGDGAAIGPRAIGGSLGDASNTAGCRYLLTDVSTGAKPVGVGGGAGFQGSATFEYIGPPGGTLSPSAGLSSLSMNLSSNGLFSKVTYQSRPTPPLQEKTMQKITPRKTLFK